MQRRPRSAQLTSICWLLTLLLPMAAMSKVLDAVRDEPVERQTHHAVRLRGERGDFESMQVRSVLNAPLDEVVDIRATDGTLAGDHAEREWLIHLKGPIHRDLRVQLATALGVDQDALSYVPSNSFLVASTHARVQAAKASVQDVLWAGHVLPHHKVSPELYPVILDEFPDARPPRTSARRRTLASEEDAVELAVSLAPHSHHRAAVTGAKWAERLGCEIPPDGARNGHRDQQWLRVVSPKKVVLRLHRRAVTEALQFISQQHETSWVERRERFRLRNKWAQGIIQSGHAFHTPIFQRGLRGENQIIGIADTGIDMDLCFFKDNNVPLTRILNKVDRNHRKVISYRYMGSYGSSRDEEGHGSHTTGSLVGKALSGADQEYNGMAPEAKLIFDDIYANGELSPPDDLETELFPVPYQQGARVRSESWGGDSMFYTTSAKETDAFSRAKRDFLVVWAAGNDGDLGMFTIGSPATAKNILCIGAQQSSRQSMMQQTQGTIFLTLKAAMPAIEDMTALAKWANFGVKTEVEGSVVLGDPIDACSDASASIVQGKVALVQVRESEGTRCLICFAHPCCY